MNSIQTEFRPSYYKIHLIEFKTSSFSIIFIGLNKRMKERRKKKNICKYYTNIIQGCSTKLL